MYRIGAWLLVFQPEAIDHSATAWVMDRVASLLVRPVKLKRVSDRCVRRAVARITASPFAVGSGP